MATTKFTNSVTLTDAAWFDDVDKSAYSYLTGVAGTNTITATGPISMLAYAVGLEFEFIPAITNTAATTINITGASALGARNIFSNGAACVGGELRATVPVKLIDDGTRFHILSNAVPVPFVDTYPVVVGSADSTKKVRFEVDGLTTATTRVLTVPDADMTLIGTGANTLTGNQTLSAAALNEALSTVASATTPDIWAAGVANVIDYTGTATATGFAAAPQAGARRTLVLAAAAVFTAGANMLIDGVASASNFTGAAGDKVHVIAVTTTQFRLSPAKADGTAVVGAASAGQVIQVVNVMDGALATGTTAIPYDDTIPQITEGDQYMSLAITPGNTNNKLRIDVVVNGASTDTTRWIYALFQDSTANALAATEVYPVGASGEMNVKFTHYMTAGTVSATTFRVRAGGTAGTFTFNGAAGARKMGGIMASSITISEVKV